MEKCYHVSVAKDLRKVNLNFQGKYLSLSHSGNKIFKFQYCRGVAVDEFGYICVADSGNNRIQIFHPDGR